MELMVVAAVISAYLVARYSAGAQWPNTERFATFAWTGPTSALLLLGSIWCAWRIQVHIKASQTNRPLATTNTRLYGLALAALGVAMVGLLAAEATTKYTMGLWPSGKGLQIYAEANYEYLAEVKRRTRNRIDLLENAKDQPAARLANSGSEHELVLLYQIQSGVIDWTLGQLEHTSNHQETQQHIQFVAWQIFPNTNMPSRPTAHLELNATPNLESHVSTAPSERPPLPPTRPTIEQKNSRAALLERFPLNQQRGLNAELNNKLPVVIRHGQAWMSYFMLVAGLQLFHLTLGTIGALAVATIPRYHTPRYSSTLWVFWLGALAPWVAMSWLFLF